MSEPRIIVVGGGIGGLSLAIAARDAGLEAHVYEQDPELRQIGAGLHLWTNAVRILQPLGVADKLQERASVMEKMDFRTWKGSVLASWPIGDLGREEGAPTLQISREHLHKVLLAVLGDEPVHLGAKVTGYEDNGSEVSITLEDGSSHTGDVLVGADGLRSVVRSQIHGEEAPRYAGYTVWRGVVQDGAKLIQADQFASLWGKGERFVFYDIGMGQLYWMSVANNASPGTRTPGSVKAMLAKRHKGWMSPIEAMIDATPEEDIHQTDIYDRPPLESWGRGRATLLGDAAHPMTFNVGQGACQGVEDAAVLVKRLKRGGEIESTLREYEASRRERSAKFQNLAWRLGTMGKWTNPVMCGVRDNMMRITYRTVALKEHKKDMEYVV